MKTHALVNVDSQFVEVYATPLSDSIEQALAHKLTESTRLMYGRDVRAYETFARESNLNAFDARTFEAWRDAMVLYPYMEDKFKSPNTINRMISAVKTTIRKAQQQGLLSEDMAARFEKTEGVALKALKKRLKEHSHTRISPQEMKRLCEAPDATTLVGKRDQALLAFLASSGARASEAASLTRGQIESRAGKYIVYLQGKTDIEYREAHISVKAYKLIMAWLDARNDLSSIIFTSFTGRGHVTINKAMSEVAVWQIVQKYAKACELEHIKPHDFRRFVGTQLAKKDIRKAQLALGHKSIEVTAKHYVLDHLEPGETDDLY